MKNRSFGGSILGGLRLNYMMSTVSLLRTSLYASEEHIILLN